MAKHHEIATPPLWQRRIIGIGIATFLISQIAIPTSYYLQDEPTSERFSWRMFSSIDLSTWKARVTVMMDENGKAVEREIDLRPQLQETYIKTIEKAQFDIVDVVMQRVANQPGVSEVRFETLGSLPSGKMMDPIQLRLRSGGTLIRVKE